jgi:Spy/CpxP family protein refolding chaperone
MRLSLMKYAAVAALATGMVFAQAPTNNSQPAAPSAQQGRHGFMRRHVDRIAQMLNLTDAQKQQARAIFQQARQSAQPVRQQLKQSREVLTAAAKANKDDAEIQKLAAEQGRLLGQMVAIRTEASAKFYHLLTPEQRVKADQMHQQFRQNHASERKNG